MYILEFKKNGEHLYTFASRRDTHTHNRLLLIFEDFNKLLLLQRQNLSFFNPQFVEQVRDICIDDPLYYHNFKYHILPDRVDVKYLR